MFFYNKNDSLQISCHASYGWLISNHLYTKTLGHLRSYLARNPRLMTRLVMRVAHVEQELLTFPEHVSLPSVFIEVRVARSLFFGVVFCRWLFVFFSFFWPCIDNLSSIYDFSFTFLVSSHPFPYTWIVLKMIYNVLVTFSTIRR